jgi:hypothetical protein
MRPSEPNPEADAEAREALHRSARRKKATGSDDANLQLRLMKQAIGSLTALAGTSEKEQDDIVQATLAAMRGIAPQGELEGMLAVQMVSTHNAAMECLRRAMFAEQTFAGMELNLKHAAKLMALYARQLETLDKHRGKGQQKITVEHVNVHAGGQAIVGNVEAGVVKAPASSPSPPVLESKPNEAMPMLEAKVMAKSKTKTSI